MVMRLSGKRYVLKIFTEISNNKAEYLIYEDIGKALRPVLIVYWNI